MLVTIERFTQQAVDKNLSAGAILLWQRLYCTMQRKGQYTDVQQNTAALMASLKVSRQGLQQMRQMLVDKGFLAVRVDEHQQIFDTLMIDGKVVGEKQVESSQKEKTGGPSATFCAEADLLPSVVSINTTKNYNGYHGALAPTANADIILTNRYRQYIDAFCDKFGPAMKTDLLQWADMRAKNGWTLTLWGLEVMFKKLIDLSAGDVMQMGKIVAQSVKRRWKGFFPISVKEQPSGEKLLKQEQRQKNGYGKAQKSVPIPKFAPEGRDLSFLER